MGSTVGVHGGAEGAHFSGLERCGSIWACPVCSAVIRAKRAEDIQRAADLWQTYGRGLAFVTLTLRHRQGDPLAVTLNAALEGWRLLVSSAAWKRLSARLGLFGYVRAAEITWGESGWHPHLHVLLFTETTLSETDLTRLQAEVFARWVAIVERLGARLPSRTHGVDVRPVTDGQVLASYLAKVQEKRTSGVGRELGRGDLKAGHGGNLAPFDLLDEPPQTPARALWGEYYDATKGRRAITWARKLLRWFTQETGEDADLTDADIVEQTAVAQLRLLIPGENWDQIRDQPQILAGILHLIETEQVEVAAVLAGGAVVLPADSEPD